jgi:uncharacterized damage-inducible protein DinB
MSAVLAAVEPTPVCSGSPLAVLAHLLSDLRDVIGLLLVPHYRAQPAARVSGSVGAHVRHTLDHVAALLSAIEGNELRYDYRQRGTTVEIDPLTGVNEIERLLFRLDCLGHLDHESLDAGVSLSTLLDPCQPAVSVRTTLAREVAFVIQHTIHHCALVAVLLEWQGVRVPYGFGVAPATARTRLAS